MGFADSIRIMLGNLTPEEIAERDDAARRRREANDHAMAAASATAQVQDEQDRLFQERLVLSGGIATLPLICHADTWIFIEQWMNVDKRGFWNVSPPWLVGQDRITKDGFMWTIRLSGPQVAEILARIGYVAQVRGSRHPYGVPVPSPVDVGIASRIYAAVCDVVDKVDPDAPREEALPPVVIDDRPGKQEHA